MIVSFCLVELVPVVVDELTKFLLFRYEILTTDKAFSYCPRGRKPFQIFPACKKEKDKEVFRRREAIAFCCTEIDNKTFSFFE